LETKKISADLHNEDFANQTIRYSWNKGATWALLTNFESIVVFNAQDIKRSLADKLYFEIPYTEYLSRFDQLWLLSKESFQNDSLDKDAEAHGKKFQKIPVTSLLYEDLEKCRDILTKELGQMNEKVSPDLLDEGVQKLLDRLIFIRVAEDRGVEDKVLIPLAREARFGNGNGKLYESMVKKFREFDDFYNSNLFSPHPFEQWEEYSGVTERVIKTLYGKAGYYEYDFKAMPADVLGAVYESYLGHRLAKSKKGLTVAKDAGKRKEHGIYYTPSFIVDYIVKNALGPILDKCKSVSDLKKIKVLDPACGSGSFLIKAFNMISEKYKDFGAPDNEFIKIQILEENIYGVDLDPQAVEITRLNLLINTLGERMKLPLLDNIKNGNSLISGTDGELEKYFGKNFRDKKPFNWQEEFPEVFKQGGFDVVIGNPPYVVLEAEDEHLAFLKKAYLSSRGGKVNLYKVFIERGATLLKNDGYLGFICPSNYLSSADSEALRKILIEDTNLIEIIEYSEKDKVFEGVTQALTTLIFKKTKDHKNHKIHLVTKKHGENLIQQEDLVGNDTFEFIAKNKLIEKIDKQKIKISDWYDCYQGEINVSTKKEYFTHKQKNGDLPLLRGNNVVRYWLITPEEFCPMSIDNRGHWENKRIVLQEVSNQQQERRIKAVLVDKNVLCGHTTNYCFPKNKKANIYYLLGLLNSKLVDYYFKYFNNTNHVPVGELKTIPIPETTKLQQTAIGNLAQKLLMLQKKFHIVEENSEKWNSIKSEIEKTDKKIDEEVYKLYGLTQEEIKIVENI
jgi:Alw26I/Eco31I/Esp3I family type II restriction m6 adenine DNA methyltransferase